MSIRVDSESGTLKYSSYHTSSFGVLVRPFYKTQYHLLLPLRWPIKKELSFYIMKGDASSIYKWVVDDVVAGMAPEFQAANIDEWVNAFHPVIFTELGVGLTVWRR